MFRFRESARRHIPAKPSVRGVLFEWLAILGKNTGLGFLDDLYYGLSSIRGGTLAECMLLEWGEFFLR
jgi:hypothetical protein